MRKLTVVRVLAMAASASLIASCGRVSEGSSPLPAISNGTPNSGVRHLEFDKDVITDPHLKEYLFVKGRLQQYLFPDAESFKTAHTLIVESYAHIFVFPLSVSVRHLNSLAPLPSGAIQTFRRPLNGLDRLAVSAEDGAKLPRSPECPDCIAYIDARLYDKNGRYLGIIDLAKVMKETPPARQSSERATPMWHGWPGICGDRWSPWYFDTYCIDDYYFDYEAYITIIWSFNLFRSPGVVSYTWNKATLESDMIWNWSGFEYAGSYVTYQYYVDIRANFVSRVVPLPANAYNNNIETITTNTFTDISQTDVVVDGILTSPNGTKTTVLEGSRYAIIATPI